MSKFGRVMSRRGLRSGCRSRHFTLSDLAEAKGNVEDNVYVEMDACGQLTARGGPARAVRLARLAPAPPHASALLCLERPLATSSASSVSPVSPALRLSLRLTADVPPLHELLLWFDEQTLAHLDMPFLTLRNITGKKNYTCHICDAEFEQPNPLKIHMFLSCRTFDPDMFWERCISQLRSSTSPASAFNPSSVSLPLRLGTLPPVTPVTDPAQLESLAAAWGRSRDGHVCLYCGKLYSRKYGLKIHIRTHTGYKPLRCKHCLRAFGDPSNLNKHVRLHANASNSTEHSCALCHKPLARRRDLLRHLRAHHPQHLSSLSVSDEYIDIV